MDMVAKKREQNTILLKVQLILGIIIQELMEINPKEKKIKINQKMEKK